MKTKAGILALSVISILSAEAANTNFLNGKPFEYLNSQITANAGAIADLSVVTDQLTADIAAINASITLLEQTVVINTAAISDIRAQIAALEDSLNNTQNDVSQLFSDLLVLKQQHEADIANLQLQIQEQRAALAALRARVNAAVVELGGEIATLQTLVTENSGDIQALLASTTSMIADILAMNVILDDHESRLQGAESSLTALNTQIVAIQATLVNIEVRLSGVETTADYLLSLHTTTFAGIKQNVPQSSLNGWEECYSGTYGQYGVSLDTVKAQCNKSKIMLACRETGSPVLKVAAYADRLDVFFDVGTAQNATHEANGVNWYYSPSYSWGFAPQGESVSRTSCDTNNQANNDRICYHTGGNALQGGWRCGDAVWLNGSTAYERVILQAD